MESNVETSVSVSQLPPPITVSGDSDPLPPSVVTVTPTPELVPPPDENQPGDTSTRVAETTASQEADQATSPPPATARADPDPTPESETTPPVPEDTPPSQDTQDVEEANNASEPPPPPPPPEEHAYWAEIEEDDSVPDEAELKEIESTDGDYSAREYSYWEKSFYQELDDPEYRPTEKARLTWKIKGVRGTRDQPNRAKIMRSPPAYVGGYWWTIKFFPRGNNVGSLSVYIECSSTMPTPDKELPETEFKVLRGTPDAVLSDCPPDMDIKFAATKDSAAWAENYQSQYKAAAESFADQEDAATEKDWRVSAQIGVILYNPDEPRTGWMQSSCHQFNPHNLDWGWTNFHGPWDQIHRRQRGQRQALLRNDTLAFDAYIRIFDDPTKSLWWHASDSEPTWDSLGLTGYRPLGDSVVNHSAEVAGLASWLHIAPFCKIIQGVDVLEHLTNCEVKPKPLCDALQKFLWLLRCRDYSLQYVDTDVITSTLRNMNEYSSDVTEFWERLRRTLELELAGTDAAKDFAKLFDSPAAGLDVNTLPTEFNSRICFPADKVKSVQSALDEYLGAKSGPWSLPPILNVELSRQKLDKMTRQWRLVYDRVELNEDLDLTTKVVDGQCGKYVLYGYIVHRGRRTSGKFFSILRPGGPGTKWLAFDDGSDNRVECLTKKTAFSTHLGLDGTATPNEKTGHDVPVTVMYIRSDVVHEYLPGPQGPWDAPEAMKKYYECGTYPFTEMADGKKEHNIQVEVYSLPQYNQLGSLFDTYDLMSQSKAANSVMYLTVPSTSTLVELRKKIAVWKSSGTEQVPAEHIRLWQIGHARNQIGPTLTFTRIADLDSSLDFNLQTVRFWMEVVSESDAKYFAMNDPPPVAVSEDKPEDAIVERDGPETPQERSITEVEIGAPGGNGAEAGSSDTAGAQVSANDSAEPVPVAESASSDLTSGEDAQAQLDATLQEEPLQAASASSQPEQAGESADTSADTDAIIAAIIANDLQESDAATTEQPAEPSVPEEVVEVVETPVEPPAPEMPLESSVPETPAEPEVKLPVRHVYYFIQIFDVEKQALRTVGSFFSRAEENIKSELRKHLGWPRTKDFLIWQRVDGITVTAMSPGESFNDVFVPDGACFIVGDRLTKERRSELGAAGLFANPDRLVQYLWAESRNHPTQAFTGTKTIEATFSGDYYSGEFKKGYYHGKGTHISDTGVTYTGDFIFGQRHGTGKMEYPSGDMYDGDWVEDQRHGQGTFIERKTGNKYVGGYKDGKRHGKGISYWEVADEEMDLCQICYSEEQDALFYDCGHVCACVTCAKQVDICPICRKNIISVVKIYRT